MNIIFAGTPEFAAAALKTLHEAGHHIVLTLSRPDQPAGRGMKPRPCAVTQYARQHGLNLIQPRSLRLDAAHPDRAADAASARQHMMAAAADVMVVAAYGLILPQWVLDLPPLGCINIHASLLPRWRGAAPIHRAIEAGDAQTGITLMQMDAGLDTGDMIASRAIAIAADDTTATLHDKLARLGADLAAEALASPQDWAPQPQDNAAACYAHKIEKTEATVDWQLPAAQIERRIRAFDPFPGASTQLPADAGSEIVKLWRSSLSCTAPDGRRPGTILAVDDRGIHVQCGEGVLCLEMLQRPGGKRLAAADFLRGRPLAPGACLGAACSQTCS